MIKYSMDLLKRIESKFLPVNSNIATNIKPLSVVSVVYKTSSNEYRTCQGAIVIASNRLNIKVAIINPNDSSKTMLRTFFLHSPLLKSITVTQTPRKRSGKAKQFSILTKNSKEINRIIN